MVSLFTRPESVPSEMVAEVLASYVLFEAVGVPIVRAARAILAVVW